jgi:hypothetical protein
VVGFQNLPYVGQNTNVAIESYHAILKAQLKSGKRRLVGHHVDWCIYELIGNVLTQY